MYVRELRVQYRLKRLRGRWCLPERLSNAPDAALAFQRLLHEEPVEVCGLLCLSTHHDVLAYHELSRGTVDTTLVHPREVFKVALLANARAVIIGHNHPSGDPTPSADDLKVTQRLATAGDLLGIELVDHLIVAGDQYISLREAGQL